LTYSPVPLRRESLISQAADEIRRLIREQSLGPGQALPPETQLSKMLGISRNSLREALRILDGLGFVHKHPGRRVVVAAGPRMAAPTSVEPAALAQAMPAAHAARIAIEERCAALAAEVASDADLTVMESHLARFEESLKRRDLQAASDAHLAFHGAMVSAAHNPILTAMFQQLSFAVTELAARAQETLKERRQVPLHAAILHAIRARQAQNAVLAVRRHFRAVAPLVEFVVQELRPPSSSQDGGRGNARRASGRSPGARNAEAETRGGPR
jgi:GntR family transcriptional regulator, transcriptional repressor for pyruvate dehydrogenase complex